MSLGFNSKVQLADGLYHVQTEDRGSVHPFIDTLVLFQGQVLHRCSRSYDDMLVSGEADQDSLRARVEQQHRDILDALREGRLPLEKAFAPEEGVAVKLRNAGSWLVAGKASLDIQVCSRRDSVPSAGADVVVSIEGGATESETFSARTDVNGVALLSFSLPKIVDPESAALIIRARLGQMDDQIKYRLKPKAHPPVVSPR